jgi:hypothetical protein
MARHDDIWNTCYCEWCDPNQDPQPTSCGLCGELRYNCPLAPCPCEVDKLCGCGEPLGDREQELCLQCWLVDFYRHYYAAFKLQKAWREHKVRTA